MAPQTPPPPPPGGSAPAGGWVAIDHVQVAIPVGAEDAARRFYGGVLGLVEVPKPPSMAARGGAWFQAGPVKVHVGADPSFAAARTAHPALVRQDLRRFVAAAGLEVRWDDEIPGVVRCHVEDPFGNRIELIDAGTVEQS